MQISPTVLIWAPIGLLFLSAIVGIIIERHTKDACLKVFNRNFVILRMKNGRFVWGHLKVFPSCLEVTYLSPEPIDEGKHKASYVLYSKKIAEIDRIYRPAPEKSSAARAEWQKEIDGLRDISFLDRFARSIRNLYGMLKDAFSQSIGMLIGLAKQQSKTMQQVGGSDKHATEVGQSLLKVLPHAYEPIFEAYRGSEVEVESSAGDAIDETIGVLEDYTVGYILLRSMRVDQGQLPKELAERLIDTCDVIFPRSGAIIRHLVAEK